MNDSHQQPTDSSAGASFRYMVDGRLFATTQAVLTGAEIKARASVDPQFQLFLEGVGGRADKQIGESDTVDFKKPGQEHLYTMPPANFGE